MLALDYASATTVTVEDVDDTLTAAASSDSLSDGTDSIGIEASSISGKYYSTAL